MTNSSTVENLRVKSENLKNGIAPLLQQIVSTNLEIAKQIETNNATIAQATASIAQLERDNEELAVLRAENEKFISKVEESLGE